MRELPRLDHERIAYTQDQIDKVFRFETPDKLPIFFAETKEDAQAERRKFLDAALVANEMTSWNNWNEVLDESIAVIHALSEQSYYPLQFPLTLHFSCQQESILTPFGVKYSVRDDGRIRMDWRQPLVRNLDEDVDRLEELRPNWKNNGVMPRMFEMVQYFLEETGRQVPLGIPDYQSPLGLAAKLMGTTHAMYAMIEQPDKFRRLISFCADLMLDFVKELERVCGDRSLLQAGMCQPRGARGLIFDDLISVVKQNEYRELAIEPNDRVLGYLGGGELHTCGPCSPDIVETLRRHKHLTSFDFFFVSADKKRTTSQLRELKRLCRGGVVMNVLGMVFDEENFTVDFAREMREGGGVIFSRVEGSERQIRRWVEIVEKANA